MISTRQQRASDNLAARTTEGAVGRYSAGFGIALGVTSLLNAILVIIKETYETAVLTAMTALTGHHWVSQGIIDLVVFLIMGIALGRIAERWQNSPGLILAWALGGPVIGAAAIASFYLK
ncbi:MAG: hypothetical protein R3D68_20605 [Hyphomicrobiaceae bacterium]